MGVIFFRFSLGREESFWKERTLQICLVVQPRFSFHQIEKSYCIFFSSYLLCFFKKISLKKKKKLNSFAYNGFYQAEAT